MFKKYTREELLNQWKKVMVHPAVTSLYASDGAFNPDKQDSIWYEDGEILTRVIIYNRYNVFVKVMGKPELRWIEPGKESVCKGGVCDRISWLKKHGITKDEDLLHEFLDIEDYDNYELQIWDTITNEYVSEYSWYDGSYFEHNPVDIPIDDALHIIKEYNMEKLQNEKEENVLDWRYV